MSERARKFVAIWIAQHIHAQPYVSVLGGDERPAAYAIACREEAVTAGISEEEIDLEYPNLGDDLSKAIDESSATELDREIAKEP